jgi:hypothetical protein
MLLVPTSHPHRTRDSLGCLVEETLGHEAVAPPSLNLLKALSTAEPIAVLVFIRMPNIDRLDEIVANAATRFTIRYHRPFSLSRRRPPGRGPAAEELTIDSTNLRPRTVGAAPQLPPRTVVDAEIQPDNRGPAPAKDRHQIQALPCHNLVR